MYTTKEYRAEISVKQYLESYVDVEGFLEDCKVCPNYGKIWSCPPYEFDPREYWAQYRTLRLFAVKIIFNESYAVKTFSQEKGITQNILQEVKANLAQKLFEEEGKSPGSVSLSAGSCTECAGCLRLEGKPCCFPEKMRYSIESMGGNVGLTISKLMGIELEWMEEGKMPRCFVLISGLLVP